MNKRESRLPLVVLPDCCIVNTGDFLTCHSAKIQRQESRAVAKKPRDITGVLGLNFANIIHYRPKVGLTCKDSKVLTSDSWKLPFVDSPLS